VLSDPQNNAVAMPKSRAKKVFVCAIKITKDKFPCCILRKTVKRKQTKRRTGQMCRVLFAVIYTFVKSVVFLIGKTRCFCMSVGFGALFLHRFGICFIK